MLSILITLTRFKFFINFAFAKLLVLFPVFTVFLIITFVFVFWHISHVPNGYFCSMFTIS